jgi:hypothetical protein
VTGADTKNARHAAARAKILARLLDSTEPEEEHTEKDPVAFPAFIPSHRCIKWADKGGLWVFLMIPSEHAQKYFTEVATLPGKPLIAILDQVRIDEVPDA